MVFDKSTTKVRIMFHCSVKGNGTVLIDRNLSRPKLQQDLSSILVRFCQNPVGIVCNIKEMYPQTKIQEEDLSYFQPQWRDLKCE